MSPVVGTPMLRKEDPRLLTGEARYVDDLAIPGALYLGNGAQPGSPRPRHFDRHQRRARRAGRRSGVHRRRSARRVGGADAVRVAGHGRHEEPRAPADRGRQGELPGRHRRRGRGQLALRGPRRRGRGDRRLRTAAGGLSTSKTRPADRVGHPRVGRDQRLVHLDADSRSGRQSSRRSRLPPTSCTSATSSSA